ncbi:hypothetical protein E4U24_006247 [Claviceps purpurea]|nr:hypothetical protein E4U28_003804 [Claviceps purpurea]KAG6241050.1 hypothetical protein E4U24_006247 [Claviceps purpurea]
MTPNLSFWCIEPLRETFLHGQPLVSAFVGLLTLLPSLRISDRQVLRSACVQDGEKVYSSVVDSHAHDISDACLTSLTTALRLKKSSSILMFDA